MTLPKLKDIFIEMFRPVDGHSDFHFDDSDDQLQMALKTAKKSKFKKIDDRDDEYIHEEGE